MCCSTTLSILNFGWKSHTHLEHEVKERASLYLKQIPIPTTANQTILGQLYNCRNHCSDVLEGKYLNVYHRWYRTHDFSILAKPVFRYLLSILCFLLLGLFSSEDNNKIFFCFRKNKKKLKIVVLNRVTVLCPLMVLRVQGSNPGKIMNISLRLLKIKYTVAQWLEPSFRIVTHLTLLTTPLIIIWTNKQSLDLSTSAAKNLVLTSASVHLFYILSF